LFGFPESKDVFLALDCRNNIPRACIQARAFHAEFRAHYLGEDLFLRKALLGVGLCDLRLYLLQGGTGLIRSALQAARIELDDNIPFLTSEPLGPASEAGDCPRVVRRSNNGGGPDRNLSTQLNCIDEIAQLDHRGRDRRRLPLLRRALTKIAPVPITSKRRTSQMPYTNSFFRFFAGLIAFMFQVSGPGLQVKSPNLELGTCNLQGFRATSIPSPRPDSMTMSTSFIGPILTGRRSDFPLDTLQPRLRPAGL